MLGVLSAPPAVLSQHDPPGVIPAILLGRIVPLSALRTSQGDHDAVCSSGHSAFESSGAYSMIAVRTPAPTVRPPSRMAKCDPTSSATGSISLIVRLALSPGMTISTPSSSIT